MSIQRRQILLAGGSLALAALPGISLSMAEARSRTSLISATAIPTPEARAPLQFELFYDLSRYITLNVDLDRGLAQRHFENFSNEEWGWKIAARVYVLIREAIARGVRSAPDFLDSGELSDLDQWYAQHVLDAWYEGIYRYDGKEIRVTYEDALMWHAVKDIFPVQGLSDAAYGYWHEPPRPGNDR